MKSALPKILLVATLLSPFAAHADLDKETRQEMISGAYQETQKFFELFTAVDKNCSKDTAKRLIGSALVTFKTDFLGLRRFAETKSTPQCQLATTQLKNHISKIYKENKWLLINLVKSMNGNPEFDQELACADLPVGKSRYPMMNTYRISHVRNKDYLAQFNIKYIATAGVDKSHEQTLRSRVNQCLAQTGYIQDHTGNRIKLQLVAPGSSQAQGITESKVYLSNKIRSNVYNYDLNIGCQAIIHEMLHIAGLWDEYKEKGYSCRAHAQSIMANHTDYSHTQFGFLGIPESTLAGTTGFPGAHALEAVLDAQPNEIELTQVTSINCSNDKNRIWSLLEKSPTNKIVFRESNGSYIYSTEAKKWTNYIPSTDINESVPLAQKNYVTRMMKINKMADKTANWNCKIVVDASAPRILGSKILTKSIYPIRPAHFRKIVYPSCIEKNRRYDICTKESYSQSLASGYQCQKDKYLACQNERFLD